MREIERQEQIVGLEKRSGYICQGRVEDVELFFTEGLDLFVQVIVLSS